MEKATASDLLIDTKATEHTLETPFGELIVWVKDLSWIERQEALGKFVSLTPDTDGNMTPSIDFGGYWRFVFKHCITKTEPSLTTKQLLGLKPEVGAKVQALLPGFESLTEGMTGGATGPLA
jgi:hypothetical protein